MFKCKKCGYQKYYIAIATIKGCENPAFIVCKKNTPNKQELIYYKKFIDDIDGELIIEHKCIKCNQFGHIKYISKALLEIDGLV